MCLACARRSIFTYPWKRARPFLLLSSSAQRYLLARTPWSAPLAPLGPSEPRAPQMPPSHPFYPPSVLVSGVQLFVGLALGLAFLAALLLVQARRRPPAHQSETTIRKRINDGVIRVAWRIRHPKVLAPRLYDRPCASRSRQGWRSFDDVEPSGGAELSSVVQGVANE